MCNRAALAIPTAALGVLLAFFYHPDLFGVHAGWQLLWALAATCCLASCNYVINEILDAPTDLRHPVKRLLQLGGLFHQIVAGLHFDRLAIHHTDPVEGLGNHKIIPPSLNDPAALGAISHRNDRAARLLSQVKDTGLHIAYGATRPVGSKADSVTLIDLLHAIRLHHALELAAIWL